MPPIAHQPDAADLLEHGTYMLRRALDRRAHPSARLVAGRLAGRAQAREGRRAAAHGVRPTGAPTPPPVP
jgi:hypothetical protein